MTRSYFDQMTGGHNFPKVRDRDMDPTPLTARTIPELGTTRYAWDVPADGVVGALVMLVVK